MSSNDSIFQFLEAMECRHMNKYYLLKRGKMTDNRSQNIIFIVIMTMLLFTALLVSDPSYAAPVSNGSGFGNLDGVLGNIVTMMTGPTAKLIAIICVAAVGIGWMYGFIDLRKAAYCVLGIAIVFGAPTLVGKLASTA